MRHPARSNLIIFSDLDGTLLDLETYSHLPSRVALQRLIAHHVPLIFCSSKTRAEQQFHQQQIGIRAPFIVENGSAIVIPQNYFDLPSSVQGSTPDEQVIELGVKAERIGAELKKIRTALALRFRCFGELSAAAVSAATGLDCEAAGRAQQRGYSETIIGELSSSEIERLQGALLSKGLSCTRGSRFYTVTAAQADKGKAVRALSALFRQQSPTIETVGIGDAANDAAMLAAVDLPYLLQQPDGHWADIALPGLNRVQGIGSTGWNDLVSRLLDKRQLQ